MMFFQSWSSLYRIIIVGTLAYIALIFVLRISGKRTLSKLNAFDLVVTVALGSTLATVMIDKNVSLAEGALALVLLVLLQFIIAQSSSRVEPFRRLVTSKPSLVMHRGEFLEASLRRERLAREDVLAAIRQSGKVGSPACSVVLESDGSLSVFEAREPGQGIEEQAGSPMPIE